MECRPALRESPQVAASTEAPAGGALLLARHLGDELRDVLGIGPLHHIRRHDALAQTGFLAALRRVRQAAVLDRVQHKLLGGLDLVEVRAYLAYRIGRGQRVAEATALSEDLATML